MTHVDPHNSLSLLTFPCMRRRMVRVTLRPPSDWTLVGSMPRGSETKAPSWDGMCSEGEGVGWYSSQPDTCKHNKNIKAHVNAVISYMSTSLNRQNTNSNWLKPLVSLLQVNKAFPAVFVTSRPCVFYRRSTDSSSCFCGDQKPVIFTGGGTVSISNHGDQNRSFRSDYEVFRTLFRCFLW